ncbi:IgaA/UmoB family intracellular growth attenuator [Achromobacter sp. Bel]|uniref:IgaA/UmoB family intracellular growth attenuator n=1 Tax=Achromobacter sp. Bel TaxID=2727415 RepID=UPI00145CAFBC|nr:IgaA/UmoB family intracellular growth attenuator [Achromobacter sp. Bel]NMK48384.1 intracellular growth attenuator family protein [Achromobacter sp. Bel]
MDANTLKIGLMLIILVWSIISWITYMVRRSDNKGALRELRQEGEALRAMTSDERALVQPFLVSPANPKKVASLVNEGIVALKGPFVRHGLQTGQGGSTMHDTLGGVDVVLPYDARDYLLEDNQAEVVMTEKFAIVVALNGQFDIAGGRDRDVRRQKQGQQWSGGKVGALQDVVPVEVSAESGKDEREFADALRVEILSQRDETPAEIAERQRPGIGFWIAMVWLLVFAGLAATVAGGGVAFAGAATALAVLALWLTGRRRAPDAPQKVNQARGELNAVVLTNPENTQAVSTQLFLGDKLPIKLPDHWRSTLTLPEDGRVDVDVRVDDYAVLRLGGNYSLDEEQRRFPRVYWGRHATLALVGMLAGVAVWVTADNLRGDAALTSAWLRGEPARSYESAAALAQDQPGFGTMVSLQGHGRCELRHIDEFDRAAFDCHRLRWNGAPPQAAPLEVDAAILQLYSGDFLKTRPNPMMDMMIRSQAMRQMGANPMALYGARSLSAETVVGLSKTVLTIELACESATGAAIAACDQLKKGFVDALLLAREEPGNWLELLRLVEAGAFNANGRRDDGVLMSRDVRRLRELARPSMAPAIKAALDRASRSAMATQKGGVVLNVLPGPYATLPDLKDLHNEDLLAAWGQQKTVMSPEGAMPFKLAGMVVGVGADASGAGASGAPEITVDASRSLDDPWPALARMAWLALAALLVLVHAPLALIRMRAASARERALQEYVQQRSAAKPAFF